MDYKELLRKYMAHVRHWNGTTMVELTDGGALTNEEQDELKRISQEIGE